MRQFRTVMAALAALVLSACGDGSIQSPDFTSELVSLSVAPQAATAGVGETVQFSATGRFTAPPGSNPEFIERPVSNVSWTSSNTAVATVDPASGLATAVAQGTAQIRASGSGASGSATLTVGPPVLRTIAIIPANPTVPVDGAVLLTATGTLSNGTTQSVQATWTSADTTRVTVNPVGPSATTNATGVSVGGSVITATVPNPVAGQPALVGTTTVTVRARVLTLTVAPDPGTSPVGRPIQFSATGTIKTGPTTTVPGSTTDNTLTGVVWSVANQVGDTNPAPVAVIDSTRGIATGQRIGTAVVTATVDAISDNALFNVTAAVLDRLAITPDGPSIPVGGTQALTATGVFTDGRAEPVSSTWTLEPASPVIVSFTPNPAATTTVRGLIVGSGTIRATAVDNPATTFNESSLTDTTAVTVTNAVLQSLVRVQPPTARVAVGRSVEFMLIGMFSGGAENAVSDSMVTWSSSDLSVATIGADGVATGVGEGQTTITATFTGTAPITGGNTRTAVLTVTNSVCTMPLLDSEGAQVTPIVDGLCLGCAVLNAGRIIDASPATFATLFAPIQLSNPAIVAARVTQASTRPPFASGTNAGFIVGRPGGLLSAQVLDRLQVSTLLNGVVQETKTGRAELRVDLLGQQILETGDRSDVALISLQTSTPYNAIQITARGEVAQVLDDTQVFQACGEVTPPVPMNLARLKRIEPSAATIIRGQGRNLVAIGEISTTLTEVEIADADLIWTSSNPAVATVDANGFVAGVDRGTVTITATLRSNVQTPTGANRSAISTITVVDGACTTPFSSFPNVTVQGNVNGLCLLCSTANEQAAADGVLLTSATASIPVGLLDVLVGTSVSLSVRLPPSADDLPGGPFTGFVLGRPVNPLLQAELLDSIQVSTLRRNALGLGEQVIETRNPFDQQTPLRVDLLGLPVVGEDELVLAGFRTTLPYDGIRVTFNAGVLSALSNFRVFESCATAVEPVTPTP